VSRLSWQVEEQATEFLRAGNLAECDRIFCSSLRELPESPYHLVIELQFTNSPILLAAYSDQFFSDQSRKFEIGAAGAVMNGFDINTDRWYCDLVAYKYYGAHTDYDWLAYEDATSQKNFLLTGMEPLQQVFARFNSYSFKQRREGPNFEDERDIAGLVVVSRFQQLVARAAPIMKHLKFPLLSTAHEYDFIAEVRHPRIMYSNYSPKMRP
jgi:hypothetical protein